MSTEWLLDNSDFPIKYILTKDKSYIENFMKNYEVLYWLSQKKQKLQ